MKALLDRGSAVEHGHDEERMLRALREIMDQPGDLPMRIGVNTGKVFTGDFGPPYRRAYRVFGDAINTAARVMSKADAGQILSTAIVLERSRTTFETTPIEPFRAKGKAQPGHASVVGPDHRPTGTAAEETPLLGRNAELGALLDAMSDEVQLGEGWIVEISGEPGSAVRVCPGAHRTLPATSPSCTPICEEYESLTPYFAFREPMRTVLGARPSRRHP